MTITRKHIFSFLFLFIFMVIQFFSFSFLAKPASADKSLIEGQEGVSEIRNVFGWEERSDIRVIIAKIIQIVLGFLAIIFVVLIIYAGFKYMTAAGNEDQTKKATAQITDAIIGLVIILASWVITTATLRYLTRAVNNNVQLFDR